ncbi:DUF4367 domain-containing protein [Bacillus salacetis]|uniref:DUF4367 domain-containing protein n=1 Tax=Bacillus salacetis TaxID=2315464 RepID=A0A3A1QYN8_9BACI|nr:DUF4367 domain-containing protein [Bacillus salacetis]RIW31988.1 DUF4367 domain-containing protein [Bacillus salacetis]
MKDEEFDTRMKDLFTDDRVPSPVKKKIDSTYELIREEGKRKTSFSFSRGVRAVLIGVGLITLSVVGAYASQGFTLFNSDGDVLMELTEPKEEMKKWDLTNVENYKEQVEDGQALVYYQVSDYPEKNFTIYRKPHVYKDLDAFKEAILHSYTPEKTLPFGYIFNNGKITVDARQSQFEAVQQQLYSEAKTSDQEVVARVVPVEESQDQIVAIAQYDNGEDQVFVRSSSKIELYENMPLKDGELAISKVAVNGHEAFYLKDEEGDFPYHSVIWIEGHADDKIMYEVLSHAVENVKKEQLMQIAESINNH